jgi:hypothetical protein
MYVWIDGEDLKECQNEQLFVCVHVMQEGRGGNGVAGILRDDRKN